MLRTWDIFDTLIARKCIYPQVVFQIVEQFTKFQNFANARMAAEQIAGNKKNNYNLDDIYEELVKISNLDIQLAERLKQIECEVEIEQAIPITENLNQVKSGDILITDMYLPEKIIRKMLDKVGLFVPVDIVVQSSGKSKGGCGIKLNLKIFIFFILVTIQFLMLKIQDNMVLILRGQY